MSESTACADEEMAFILLGNKADMASGVAVGD